MTARVIRAGTLRSARSIYLYFRSRGKASRTNPRIGDLVVWGRGSHIGIYVGNGKAISTLRSGVRIHGVLAVTARFTAYLHTGMSTKPASELRPPAAGRASGCAGAAPGPRSSQTVGVLGYPAAASTRARHARIAAAERSMSASVVDQPETEMRIAARPCHVVPPSQQRAVALDRGDHRARPRVAGGAVRVVADRPRTGRGPG